MLQNPVVLAAIFLVAFAGLTYYFTVRTALGHKPTLRPIQAFETLKGLMGRAIETGRALHISVGVGGVANETTADTLAGLSVLRYLARQSAPTGVPPTISMADPAVMLMAQNVVRAAHAETPDNLPQAYRHIRWVAPQPSAYAAGVMNILDMDEVEATVMVGSFGDEYLLMGETAARRGMAHIGGASHPNTLPFVYVSAEEILMGEEIYAAGAYLEKEPTHIASLLTQDTMRWLIALLILGGIGWVSLIG